MKRIALLLAATAFSVPALAADVIVYDPVPAAFTPAALPVWSGFYAGVQAGGAFNPSTPDNLGIVTNGFGLGTGGAGGNAPAFGAFEALSVGAAFGDNYHSSFDSGFIGGAHVGYDWQFDSFVLGGILDINATDITIRQSADSNTPAFYTAERELDYLATARLRAGYLVTPSVLAYATGGVAYGEVDYSFRTDSPVVTGTPRSATNAAATPAIINEDEDDLYTNLGGGDSFTRLDGGLFNGPAGVAGSTDFRSTGDFDFHTVTAKLSYRFN